MRQGSKVPTRPPSREDLAMQLVPQTTESYLEGVLFFRFACHFPWPLVLLCLYVLTAVCSGVVSLSRSFFVCTTSPEGGTTYILLSFLLLCLFESFLCFPLSCYFFLLLSLVYTRRICMSCLLYPYDGRALRCLVSFTTSCCSISVA